MTKQIPTLCSRFETLLNMSVSPQQAPLAIRLTQVYIVMLGKLPYRPESLHVIEHILALDSVRVSAKGDIYLALAKMVQAQGRGIYEEYLIRADEHYAACENMPGLWEVDMMRQRQSSVQMDVKITRLYTLLEQSETIDYPMLLLRASTWLLVALGGVKSGATKEQADIEASCYRKAQDMATKIGARLHWSLTLTLQLTIALGQGRFGKIIACEDLLDSEMMIDIPHNNARFSTIMSFAYSRTGDLSKIQYWVNRAKQYSQDTDTPAVQSDVAYRSLLARTYVKSSLSENDRIESTMLEEISKDRENGNLEGAFDKILALVTYTFLQDPIRFFAIRSSVTEWLAAAKEIAVQLPDPEIALTNLISYNIYVQRPLVAPEDELGILNNALHLCSLRNDNPTLICAMFRIAEAHLRSKDRKRLQDAIDNYIHASERCEVTGFPIVNAFCHFRLAKCHEALGHSASDTTKHQVISLEHLKKAAGLIDMMRHESSVLPALKALSSNQHMRAEFLE